MRALHVCWGTARRRCRQAQLRHVHGGDTLLRAASLVVRVHVGPPSPAARPGPIHRMGRAQCAIRHTVPHGTAELARRNNAKQREHHSHCRACQSARIAPNPCRVESRPCPYHAADYLLCLRHLVVGSAAWKANSVLSVAPYCHFWDGHCWRGRRGSSGQSFHDCRAQIDRSP
jgi:hypothetical protein